ncbi:unnamed protein product [Cyprideis torosa]|uniref:Ubiquitin-related modifier 1 homolog n=1 Tax=Cyprideis torosa TaxID=163714 RepID=A0A7R8ZJS8_9CRUS|nr:unnamed protein product [Cyprideis torosa]CAG0880281.1 unnamed protein product [Cyprideis torosa]
MAAAISITSTSTTTFFCWFLYSREENSCVCMYVVCLRGDFSHFPRLLFLVTWFKAKQSKQFLPVLCCSGCESNHYMALSLTLEFIGGAELLCSGVRKHEVTVLPQNTGKPFKLPDLFDWIKLNIIKERPEFLFQGETIRPGVLVIINDSDWELEGELDYEVKDKDKISFVSTLHGG